MCRTCGASFSVNNYRIKTGGGRYCSKACRGKGMSNQVTLACETCGKSFERKVSAVKNRVFCSRSCDLTRNAQPIILSDDGLTARVPLLTRDGTVVAYALIDAADAQWAGQWTWNLGAQGYAVRSTGIRMHRELLGLVPGDGLFGDHINRNRLDNRRSNLRVATPAVSEQNVPGRPGSSIHRGVSLHRQSGLWWAYVHLHGKKIYSEFFVDELEAAEAARLARAALLPYAVD